MCGPIGSHRYVDPSGAFPEVNSEAAQEGATRFDISDFEALKRIGQTALLSRSWDCSRVPTGGTVTLHV